MPGIRKDIIIHRLRSTANLRQIHQTDVLGINRATRRYIISVSQCLRGKKPVFGTDLDASALAAVGGGLAFDACSVIMPGMQISQHADRSEALTGLRAEDIHRWIDGLFDAGSFADFKRHGQRGDFEPYRHRKYYASLFQMENKNKVLSV